MKKKHNKSFRTLADDLKRIRKQRPSQAQIDKANAILGEVPEKEDSPQRKIAKHPGLEAE